MRCPATGNNPYVVTVSALTEAYTPTDRSDDYIAYYLVDPNGTVLGEGYAWSGSYAWADGYAWMDGYAWANSVIDLSDLIRIASRAWAR